MAESKDIFRKLLDIREYVKSMIKEETQEKASFTEKGAERGREGEC